MTTKPRSIGDILQEFAQHRQLMQQELQKVIVGQNEVIEQLFAAIFTRGHCLLEGVPGLAKTLMVSTLSQILDVSFKRVQFTPDLMPADITGTNVLEEESTGRRNFRFVEGPVFTNILLADEINRTPPKTQAALLQAMQEREVSVGRTTYPLPDPFFTIATQNPIEQEGTYPLPEAQLDRFMFNIKVDYPSAEEEERILAVTTRQEKVETRKVMSAKVIVNVQRLVNSVAVSEYIIKYVARLVRATRPKDPTAPEFVRELVDWAPAPRRPVPDQRRQSPGRDGRPLLGVGGRRPQDRRPRSAAPHQHQFPGPGRGPGHRRPDPPLDEGDPRTRDSQVRQRRDAKSPHPAAPAERMIGQVSMQLTPEQQEQVRQAKAAAERRVHLRFTPEQRSEWRAAVEEELAAKDENIAHWRKVHAEAELPGFFGDLRRAVLLSRRPFMNWLSKSVLPRVCSPIFRPGTRNCRCERRGRAGGIVVGTLRGCDFVAWLARAVRIRAGLPRGSGEPYCGGRLLFRRRTSDALGQSTWHVAGRSAGRILRRRV